MDAPRPTLMALALAGLIASGCSASKDPVTFEVRRPDPARIKEQNAADTEALGDYTPADQAARVVKFFHAANLLTVSLDPVDPTAQEMGLTNLRMSAKRLRTVRVCIPALPGLSARRILPYRLRW